MDSNLTNPLQRLRSYDLSWMPYTTESQGRMRKDRGRFGVEC